MNIKSTISHTLLNLPGWHTRRKIVVIESDDWGSIRMPSKEVYNKLFHSGVRVDYCPYNKYDSLENEEDLSALFEILTSFRDKNGHHPVFTANTVVANPDFNKIKTCGYQHYYYEPFTETYNRNPKHKNTFETIIQGINDNIYYPQFHGREHVNVKLWLSLLQEKNELFLKAFDLGLWGIGSEVQRISKIHIQASFDCFERKEVGQHAEIIKDGLKKFYEIFGYKSKSFIANNFIWDTKLNKVLADEGVKYIQGMKYQKMPIFDGEKRKLKFHYTGERNNLEQLYLIRNCSFEPTENPRIDNISKCLNEIQNSFFLRKPAIISTHRLNYIGSINKDNRDNNLRKLKILLESILKKWPDVEFMTTVKLGDDISTVV